MATPGTRLSSGLTSNSARSRKSLAGIPPVRLIMKLGKSDGVIRSTWSWVPSGSSPFTSSVLPCMSCRAYFMSASGLKRIEISVAPRIVFSIP